ncbi:MAG TPA: hypothetical protein VFF73_19050, partial [Planctomycetota bacterium]|nr:hypothetical protein [Planctomycetota bacterium]
LFRFGPSWALGAAAAATLGALGLGFLDRAPEVAREAKATLSQQRHKRGFLVAALFTNFALWGLGNTVIALVPVLGAELSMGESLQGALLFGLVGAQSGIFVVLGERKDLTYKAIPLIGVSVLGALAALALDLAPNIPIAVVASLGVGALGGAAYAFSIFYSLDYDERRGLRMSVNEAVLGLGGMLPLAGSRLAHVASAPRLPYLFAGGVCVACGLVAVSCLWTRPE